MTKWKTQGTKAIIFMHSHNRWSQWYSYILQAADDLGLIVCEREFANGWDGSRDREWLVSSHMLDRVGGLDALHKLADKLRDENEARIEMEFGDRA